ncbi:MAG: DUF2007 domain-containing protein [Bacteroidales bacterium]|jgi:hypothetical protein|nr:DUF2007 domain-containing protein [Bacteroidales bacterium]MCI1784955.1 DUF2007 domain-containing protein [Bacteroidales bacterium]
MKEKELMIVGRYYNAASAHIAAGMLMENGIKAAVFGDVSSYPNLSFTDSVVVKVNAEDYEAAKNLLEASDKAE